VDFILHPAEVRVLGALLEKDIATPEYYPMTLNALVNACNQKSNRDPVVSYDDEAVQHAIETLQDKRFIGTVSGGNNRVPKYAHRISERLNLGRRELAILCELMLRGPQTPGELRGRASRLYDFSDIEEVDAVLRGLMERTPDPLVARLAHRPGTKEARYAHLLSGEPEPDVPLAEAATERRALDDGRLEAEGFNPQSADSGRIGRLEAEIVALRAEIDGLKQQFQDFRRQFE
jgi:uncharacterized protein